MYRKTLWACYLSFISQAVSANFLPLLYLTFHENYGLSLSRLALLSTVFFGVQLCVDSFCTVAADRIGYRPCILFGQACSFLGIAGLAILPDLFKDPFIGILLCVAVYATGSGLIEVLASPIVEALPSENKEKTMSLLHSFYCWGFVGVVLLSTAFFTAFDISRWRILALLWSLFPAFTFLLFTFCPILKIVSDEKKMPLKTLLKEKILWILLLLMIGAGASEVAMAQWASAFAESALHVSKTTGDLIGPCGFAVCMGISRVLYGKFGEKIKLKLFMVFSALLCVACYLLAGLSASPVLGFIGCAVCGFSVGILWPGSISISSAALPRGSTALFALLALAGDCGAAVGPAVIGTLAQRWGNNLKAGVTVGVVFPLIILFSVFLLSRKKKNA